MRLRYRAFLVRQHYDLFEAPPGCEHDRYDYPDTTYVAVCDDSGVVVGALRLNSTLKPTMLGELWPQLLQGSAPQDEMVWEASRLCVDRHLVQGTRRQVLDALLQAMRRFAADKGIARYIGVMPTLLWTVVFRARDWSAAPLGRPCFISGMRVLACTLTPPAGSVAVQYPYGAFRLKKIRCSTQC